MNWHIKVPGICSRQKKTIGIVAVLCAVSTLYLLMPAIADAEGGTPVWTPDGRLPIGFDWIQLTNGEWFKGDLKGLYADTLEFDSDEMGFNKFDWEDIHQVICHQFQTVRIENHKIRRNNVFRVYGDAQTVVGNLRIVGDSVIVDTGEELLEFDRSRLISIAAETESVLDQWSAKITLSLDVMRGNTEQGNYSSYAEAKRRTSLTQFYIDYRSIYSTTSGVVTGNSLRAGSDFDIFSTRRFFWRPLMLDYFRDTFANIEHRGSIGAGLGYYIIATSKTEWLISPGIAYQRTRYVSVEAGEDDTVSTPAFSISTEYDTDLTKQIEFIVKYSFSLVNEQSGTYSHTASSAFDIELTGMLDLEMALVWDRIQDPQASDDGNIPEQDDLYFFCGLAFEM